MDETTHQTSTPGIIPVKKNKKEEFVETLKFLFLALLIILPIRMFVAQPFVVNGASMDTTFADGEYLIVDELSYRLREPARGDVMIFRYPKNEKVFYIKRVIGLPGETVKIQGDKVTIVSATNPLGLTLTEPYVHSKMDPNFSQTTTLGPDEFFMMGDNRAVSADSRLWGPMPRKDIIGTPAARLWPADRIEWRPGALQK